jgi:hypothetical protein
MNSLLLLSVVIGVSVSGSAQAAAADKSTDATENFLPLSGTSLTTINRFDARGDARAQLFSGSYLAMNSVEDHRDLQHSGADSSSRSGTSPSTQTGSNQLALAAHASDTSDATLQSEADAVSCSTGSHNCSLSWNRLLTDLAAETVHVVFPGGSVSMPNSVLLFGPGLLGLAVIARRRNGQYN